MTLEMASVEQIIENAKKHKMIVFDCEWLVTSRYFDEGFNIHGVGFAVPDDTEEYLAIYTTNRADIQRILDECFNQQIEAIGHYTKIDYITLLESGYTFKEDPLIRCTALALNFLEEERDRYGLKVITPEYLGYELTDYLTAAEDGMDTDEFTKYGCDDVIATLRLYKKFKPHLITQNLWSCYQIVCPTMLVLGDIERFGLNWDISIGEDLFNKFCLIRDELRGEIYSMIGRINIKSPKQLANRLFFELGYKIKDPEISKETGAISTGAKNMQKLADKYPVCEAILAYRTCEKMISTYIEPFTTMALYNDDNRIHPDFQLISKTGRLRCQRPNVQNVSVNLGTGIKHNQELRAYFDQLKIRAGFTAKPGCKLVVCDYSSIEYRTAALAAPEPKLISMYRHWECNECGDSGDSGEVIKQCPSCLKAVKQGKDLHHRNMVISNQAGADIDRKKAKAVSFLSIFGGGAWRLSQDLGLTQKVCEGILRAVNDEYPGLGAWHKATERALHRTGKVTDLFGRKRQVHLKQRLQDKPKEKHRGITKNCLNMLVNFVAQAPACTLIQIAAQNIRKRLIEKDLWGDRVRLVNIVHDELVFECDEDLADMVLELVTFEMENSVSLDVPTPVEGGIYNNWCEAK